MEVSEETIAAWRQQSKSSQVAKRTERKEISLVGSDPDYPGRAEATEANIQRLRDFVCGPRAKKCIGKSDAEMVALWAAAYVKCGRCRRQWKAWIADNAIGVDVQAWLSLAGEAIRKNRWA